MSQPMHSRRYGYFAAAGVVALAVAAVIYTTMQAPEPREGQILADYRSGVPELRFVEAESSRDLLERLREEQGEGWLPEDGAVPPVTAPAFPEDLPEVTVQERKEVFFRVLAPVILVENAKVRADREFIRTVREEGTNGLGTGERDRLERLAEHYRVEEEFGSDAFFTRLLRRVDEVPPGMAAAQAANESGWGTSRFTREANNLFGEWTWRSGEGLVPSQRPEGATHYIRVFDTLDRSVRSYYFNLNVGHAYPEFRRQRLEMRENGEALDSIRLTGTLTAYSERGHGYVDEVRSMIRTNRLQEWDRLELAGAE